MVGAGWDGGGDDQVAGRTATGNGADGATDIAPGGTIYPDLFVLPDAGFTPLDPDGVAELPVANA